jgi:hypothetical protein
MKKSSQRAALSVRVCPQWRQECLKFFWTGDASKEFLAHLEGCSSCQAVADKHLQDQAKLLQEFGRTLRQAR